MKSDLQERGSQKTGRCIGLVPSVDMPGRTGRFLWGVGRRCAQGIVWKILKVMSYNIHHGEGIDRRLDLERIAAVIADSGADIVALQELDQSTRRTGGVAQTEVLAHHLGMHHQFAKALHFQGGAYGRQC